MNSYYSSLALLALAIVLLRFLRSRNRRHLSFPPGPSPYPLIGNLCDLPTKLPWLIYTEWGHQYRSELVHVGVLGQHIVIVNSVKAAVELFEKRSDIYSDRPFLAMLDLMGWCFHVGFMPLGARLTAAIIMKTLYGYEVQSSDDHFVALSENATKKLSQSAFSGAAAVNTFPILRYLPSWMPGASFHRFAAESRRLTKEMRQVPFEFAKQNMCDGVDSESIVAKLLEANGHNDGAAIQEMAAAAYAAGADTKRAQTEIDTVIGTYRLPRFEDRPSLPYIEALYREVMRWKPVGSLVVHATTADDVYDGYFIPKGTTVIGNIWAMTRDESIYSEPERFNPDRFFTADGKLNDDDTILAFGCDSVGAYARVATLQTRQSGGTIVSVLSTFNIAKAKDDAGNEIDIDPSYSDGMISHPDPFACSITPRSEVVKSLVQVTTETYDL
ncbi:O-methylsterigmatocystin oxidoreductase [Mycena sanguinolenta]|uniref:O-methylsterigmatocystin oxidoreductase n=1 Tax=Mycena sanguinolenta TaxID=230812 RepID=A0A8H7CQF1_9AGAR|nr:O-methylsterigmatocystin oxidoreductase [Mycena sanguinolenta]